MHTQEQARAALQTLLRDYNALTREQRDEMNEASVVRQFIDRLLRDVLGWPVEEPTRYVYEPRTEIGRPDMALLLESGDTIYLEAKRFGAIKELAEARRTITGVITPGQMALPGMAVDRTAEEQQAINYAFKLGRTWAILTNFEKLRLFNARRDWLVLSFEAPQAYLDEFDHLWQLSYDNILSGSLDALSNQRYARDIDTPYLNFINEWRERLAQDIIQRDVLNAWAFFDDGSINLPRLRAVVQRYLDRLVIVRFAEDHLVIPAGTLRDFHDLRRRNIYTHTIDQFLERFFARFDDVHNSALFAKGWADYALFSDDVLLPLINKLYEARYRSMPADIIGNTYEQYLGKALALDNGSVTTRDNLETRKKQGSYYTPQVIVRYLVDTTLGRYLYATADGRPGGEPLPGEMRKTSRDVRDLRVLDSACGSGSFLIYAYEVLADFYQGEINRLEADMLRRSGELAAEGASPIDRELAVADYRAELDRIRNYPRLILETHLYGVDLDPQAAEIAVVNLIMRAMERRQHEKRLPMILGQNIKVGNGLIGLRPDDARLDPFCAEIADLIALRALMHTDPDRDVERAELRTDNYRGMTLGEAHDIPNPKARERAVDAVKDRILHPMTELPPDTGHPTFDRLLAETRAVAGELNADFAPHFSDLARIRPFHWGVEFPEVFFDADGQPLENPGFTIIVGNPPWEILKPDLREYYAQFDPDIESKLTRRQAERRIEELDAEDPRRVAGWEQQTRGIEESAAFLKACGDYERQGRGDTATHKLFLERAYGLLQDGGRIGYLVPSGLYTDLGTKELREMLLDEGHIDYLFSFSNERYFFPGVDHRFKFVLVGAQKGPQSDGFWAAFRFNPRVAVAPDDLPAFLADPDNLIYVRRESIARFRPDSLSIMEFQSRRDYEVAERIYADHPLLGEVLAGHWNVKFTREFDKTNDRSLFNTREMGLPVYEGQNLGFFGELLRPPTIWVDEQSGREKLLSPLQKQAPELTPEQIPLDYEYYRFGFRRIARSTDMRTLYVSYLPKRSFAMYTLTTTVKHYFDGTRFRPYMSDAQEMFLYSCMASFVLDFVMRFQVASSVAMFNAYSLPVPRLNPGDPYFDAIVPRAARLTCTAPAFADLWGEVMGEPWTEASGATHPAERARLRDEIDAIVAHLYGLSSREFDHILGTFPLVFPDDDAGRARREALLDVYDEWAGRLAR